MKNNIIFNNKIVTCTGHIFYILAFNTVLSIWLRFVLQPQHGTPFSQGSSFPGNYLAMAWLYALVNIQYKATLVCHNQTSQRVFQCNLFCTECNLGGSSFSAGDFCRLWTCPSPLTLIFTATQSLGFSIIFCWFLHLFSIFLHQLYLEKKTLDLKCMHNHIFSWVYLGGQPEKYLILTNFHAYLISQKIDRSIIIIILWGFIFTISEKKGLKGFLWTYLSFRVCCYIMKTAKINTRENKWE